jgi:hypothetical protein
MRPAFRCCLLASLAALAACRREPPPAPSPSPPPPAAAAPLDPLAAEEKAVLEKIASAFACFDKRMGEAQKNDPTFAAYGRSSFTDIFIFDRIFGDRRMLEQSPESICAAVLRDYKATFLSTTARIEHETRGRGPGPVPPAVDGETAFIRAAGGRTGMHLLMHGELTMAALTDFNGGRVAPIFESVRWGAERADIYRWGDLRLHGHTNPHEPRLREAEIGTSQVSFVGGITALIDRFNEELRDGSYDHAAIYLGVACHTAQDLALHRGMTRRQLAGLRFLGDKDLYGSESESTLAEARRWTKEVLVIARAAIGDAKLWGRFLAWAQPVNFSLSKAGDTIFQDEIGTERLNIVMLTRFWLEQLRYRHTPEARAELGEGPQGLIRWELAPLLERTRQSLENGGVSLHGAGRRPSLSHR